MLTVRPVRQAGQCGPTTPPPHRAAAHSACGGLGCSPFARRYLGNSLFSSGYLDVSVPPVASSAPMCSVRRSPSLHGLGCPIRVPADQLARQLPAAFRRLATPFIGSHRLGIHRAPLLAWPVLGPAVHEAQFEVARPSAEADDRCLIASSHSLFSCERAVPVLRVHQGQQLLAPEEWKEPGFTVG